MDKDELIKELLNKVWDMIHGDEIMPDEYEKYESLAEQFDSYFGSY